MRRLLAYPTAARFHLLDEDGIRRRIGASGVSAPCAQAAAVPVVVVHGFLARKSSFLWLLQRLFRGGHTHLRAASYDVFHHSVAVAAKQVHDKVRRVSDEHGGARVAVVGHSMGGIATLYAATRLGLDDVLDRAVTLGTPYGGAPLAELARTLSRVLPLQVLRTGRELAADSQLLAELRTEADELTVPWHVLYSRRDELVPPSAGRLDGPAVRCRETAPVGHAEMLLSRRVAADTLAALAA